MTLKNFFTENLGLKLFSLLAAMLLEFYFFSPDNTVAIEMQIAVELQNTPSERVIVSPSGAQRGLSSKVELVGPHHLIESVKSSPPTFRVVLPDSPPSELHFQLRREDLRLPNGVQVKSIEPSTYRLEFDRLIRRELKVQLATVGAPAAGYRLKALKVFPETVFARGPSGELEGRQSVASLPLDISNMQSSDRLDISLTEVGKLTSLEVNLVAVHVEIEEIPMEKEYNEVAVKLLTPDGYASTIDPSRVKVVLSGPEAKLNDILSEDLQPVADLRELSAGRHSVALTAELPDGVRIERTVPENVVVIMRNEHG